MDMIGRQKALADRVYALLSEDYDILLAGGAPRDWYIGSEATDLDFYVYSENPENDSMEISERLETELTPLGDDKYDRLLRDEPSLLAVYEGDFHGETVQFMFTSVPPKQFVKEKFDLSICKVWYEEGEIDMDWEARLSFNHELVVANTFGEHSGKIMERPEWNSFCWSADWRLALDWIEHKANRRVGLPHPGRGQGLFVDDGEPVAANAVPDF